MRTPVVIASLVLALLAPLAWSQADARAVLTASAEALRNTPNAQAEFSVESMATGALARLDFSGSGRLYARRTGEDAGGGGGGGGSVRLIGTFRRSSKADPTPVDVLMTPEAVRTIDDTARTLIVRDPAKPVREVAILEQLEVGPWLADEPFGRELGSSTLTLEPDAQAGGVPCRVVLATFPKPADGADRPAGEYDTVRWFIGADDHLPRRVERVTTTLLGNVGNATTFTKIDTASAIADARFEMDTPEGYTVDSNVEGIESTAPPHPTTGRPGRPTTPATPAASTSAPPRRTPAPLFDLTTRSGEQLTLDTQMTAERATVLYFFGTWSVACEPYHTRLAALASQFEGRPVDFVAVAVRERSPASAARVFADNANVKVVTDAGDTPDAFRVLVYPTFVVIDPRGGRVADERPARGETPDDVLTRVHDAVTDALQ